MTSAVPCADSPVSSSALRQGTAFMSTAAMRRLRAGIGLGEGSFTENRFPVCGTLG